MEGSRSASVHEGLCDMRWFSNLKLLGYDDPKHGLSPTMFDHSNPPAFQQVFHFLFLTLSKEKSSTEFRDCWPILDKKQEADFRRRVTQLVKDYQKDHPDELPYTNPSLFQSPGGRRFLSFLSVFTTFIMKRLVVAKAGPILNKPTVKRKNMKKACWKNLVMRTTEALDEAFHNPVAIEEMEEDGANCVAKIAEKYYEHRDRIQALGEEGSVTEEEFKEFADKIPSAKETLEEARRLLADAKESYDVVNFVMEGGAEKVKLNMENDGENNSLALTFQSWIRTVLATAERAVTVEHRTPVLETNNLGVSNDLEALKQINANLEKLHEETKEHVTALQKQSLSIDWLNCPLARISKPSESLKLLPPTPSLVHTIKNTGSLTNDACRHLNLNSPDTRLKTPGPLGGTHATPVRSVASGLSRRFALSKTQPQASQESEEPPQFNSPMLKAKEPSKVRDEETSTNNNLTISADLNSTCQSTKSSFSPMLSSTQAHGDTSFGFNDLATTSEAKKSSLDMTQKIEMYRKVLESHKTKSQGEDKKGLLTAWTKHRESLSPRVDHVRSRVRNPSGNKLDPGNLDQSPAPRMNQLSPFVSNSITPARVQSPGQDLIISRLDQLMTSLTLNENQSGLNFSMEEDLDLLSPHL